jgi:hypothetical protein
MGSPRALISALPKGHELPSTTFGLTRDDVRAYLDAVADANSVYVDTGLAPPLAVAARALGALLEVLELPDGTLHTGQEVEAHGGVPIDSELSLSGRIAQRSERAGMVICALEFAVQRDGTTALSGRTTVLTPAPSGNGASA